MPEQFPITPFLGNGTVGSDAAFQSCLCSCLRQQSPNYGNITKLPEECARKVTYGSG